MTKFVFFYRHTIKDQRELACDIPVQFCINVQFIVLFAVIGMPVLQRIYLKTTAQNFQIRFKLWHIVKMNASQDIQKYEINGNKLFYHQKYKY
jgi:endoglucanase Acf2